MANYWGQVTVAHLRAVHPGGCCDVRSPDAKSSRASSAETPHAAFAIFVTWWSAYRRPRNLPAAALSNSVATMAMQVMITDDVGHRPWYAHKLQIAMVGTRKAVPVPHPQAVSL